MWELPTRNTFRHRIMEGYIINGKILYIDSTQVDQKFFVSYMCFFYQHGNATYSLALKYKKIRRTTTVL